MREEEIALVGLKAPAQIIVDKWGIPHIRAEGLADLFFVQGVNAARDRLWQLDLWRKRGLGELAADFGPGYLEQDRAARLFLYRGDMEVEWASYASDARQICESFVAGINAWIDLCLNEPVRLQRFWNNRRPDLVEALAHQGFHSMRRPAGVASAVG